MYGDAELGNVETLTIGDGHDALLFQPACLRAVRPQEAAAPRFMLVSSLFFPVCFHRLPSTPTNTPPIATPPPQAPTPCYPSTHPWYATSTNGLDTAVKTYIEEARLFLSDPPSEVSLNNTHLNYLWSIGKNDLGARRSVKLRLQVASQTHDTNHGARKALACSPLQSVMM